MSADFGIHLCLDAEAVEDGGGLLGIQDAQAHEVVADIEAGQGPYLLVGDFGGGEGEQAIDIVPTAFDGVFSPHTVGKLGVTEERTDLANAAYVVFAGEEDDVSGVEAVHLRVLHAGRPPKTGGAAGVKLIQLLALVWREEAGAGMGGEVDVSVEGVPPVAAGGRVAVGGLDNNKRHESPCI
ncbi:hypothetical protein ACFWFU_12690 [Streptomyces sp. NPDC060235]|uniref:hypothetical protein n=1 Tax=Streptomyces sp. NPDC060235 TaxID=3347080 RepID=UPI00366A00E8